jgi:tetratricopeptide (TPR) repeat protein
MVTKQTRAVKIFCSYAHEDEPLWRELEKQLHFLKRHGLISAWHHHAIQAGQEWQHETNEHLQTSQIILLLISPAFMISDQCYRIEMREAMKLHKGGKARVIPIILRAVYWEDEPFSALLVLPKGGKPVKSWSDKDKAFLDIASNIGKIVKEILVEQLLTEVEQLYKDKRYDEALVACEQAIQFGCNSASAYLRKGNVLLSYQRYEEALAAYEQASLIDPDITDPYIYQKKGHAQSNLKRYNEALVALEQAIRLSMPRPDPRFYEDKGDILKKLAEQAYELAKQHSLGASSGTIPD